MHVKYGHYNNVQIKTNLKNALFVLVTMQMSFFTHSLIYMSLIVFLKGY